MFMHILAVFVVIVALALLLVLPVIGLQLLLGLVARPAIRRSGARLDPGAPSPGRPVPIRALSQIVDTYL